MQRELILRINGTLAPHNRISLRTISHTLPHLQRAIDKLVLFEQHGEIKKHATLPGTHYHLADLYLDEFEEGSLKIPLLGDLLHGVGSRLNQFLSEPFHEAAIEVRQSLRPLLDQLDIAHNNIVNNNIDKITQKELIARGDELERYYAQAAVLKDINTMLSPLRARSSKDDTITLTNNASGKTANYLFNHENSRSFGKVVTQKRLSRPVIYNGKLEGLRNSGSKIFPYTGNFVSNVTNKEMKLLVASEGDALLLNKFNLSKKTISLWACPLAVYEAFDQYCGDIVFVSFAEQ